MVIVMDLKATSKQVQQIIDQIHAKGLRTHISQGQCRTIIGVVGEKNIIMSLPVEVFDGVEKVVPITTSYKLVGRDFHPEATVIDVDGIKIGNGWPVVMAGPCLVESREQILESAQIVRGAGAQFLRGGAFKPRTSPYSYQGLEEQGLKYLAEARALTGLKIVTEVMDAASADLVAEYADILQIGARNMQNFQLLRAVGRSDKPVLLKRGISATIDEWLQAAEYIVNEGNFNVIMCERGIRTFEKYTSNTLDLSAVAAIKHLSHFPVIVDPSHGTGKWRLVKPMALAAIAAGADGLMIEVHPNPAEAMSDGPQSLNADKYASLMVAVQELAEFMNRQRCQSDNTVSHPIKIVEAFPESTTGLVDFLPIEDSLASIDCFVGNIVLIGFMGTGKTTTGQMLANQLGRPFVDIDQKIEFENGMTIAEMFRLYGEPYFRERERHMIAAVSSYKDIVIATGGGAVLAPENIANLKQNGTVICLAASSEVIIERLEKDGTRPLLNLPDRQEIVAKLLQERSYRYQEADFIIDTNRISPPEAAEEIITRMRLREKERSIPVSIQADST